MKQCPECGTRVPEDGNFCPECGRQFGDSGRTQAESRGEDGWQSDAEDEDWKYPVDQSSSSTGRHPADHKLLLGGVGGFSLFALLEGGLRVLSPERVANELVDTTAEAGLEIEPGFAEQVVLITGVVGVVMALAVLGLTVRNYTQKQLPNRYFWVLIATSVVGFLFASSLFLAALVAFGIYGLVVID